MGGKPLLPTDLGSFRPAVGNADLLPLQSSIMNTRAQQFLALLALAATTAFLSAQDRSYGRSVVSTQYGIVATSYVQASQAGARVLEEGGSAIDAAIAANAVLGVAEPMTNGIGGDLFAIYWDAKTGKLYGLNASGWAPKSLTIDHLKAKGSGGSAI